MTRDELVSGSANNDDTTTTTDERVERRTSVDRSNSKSGRLRKRSNDATSSQQPPPPPPRSQKRPSNAKPTSPTASTFAQQTAEQGHAMRPSVDTANTLVGPPSPTKSHVAPSGITGATYAYTAPSPYPLAQRQPSINTYVVSPLSGNVGTSSDAGVGLGLLGPGVGRTSSMRQNNGKGIVSVTYPPYPNPNPEAEQFSPTASTTGYTTAPVNFGFISSSSSSDNSSPIVNQNQSETYTPMPSTPTSTRPLLASSSNTITSSMSASTSLGSGSGSMTGIGSGAGGKNSGFVLEHGYINDMGNPRRTSVPPGEFTPQPTFATTNISSASTPGITPTPSSSNLPTLSYPYAYPYTDESKYPISSTPRNGNTPKNRPRSIGGIMPYAYNPFLDPDLEPMVPSRPISQEDTLGSGRPGSSSLSGKPILRSGSVLKAKSKPTLSGGGVETYLITPQDYGFEDERALRYRGFNYRGWLTVGGLLMLISGIVSLFVFYPIFEYFTTVRFRDAVVGNVRINATGQAASFPDVPLLIDPDTPNSAKTRIGFDNQEYVLVFSDEFEKEGRTFFPGDDPFWEAVDLWYWPTGDLEWYDPRQVTTRDGALIITMDSVLNHNLQFRSGMLQSWNKFCFTTGYIEASLSLPGQNNEVEGYWPGAWTMGNLGRPGYGASTDGMWPYSYDSCDVGTFPNQTNKDFTGPAAALHTQYGRSKYNFDLSWLSGQRLSACTCPGEDHPGPVNPNMNLKIGPAFGGDPTGVGTGFVGGFVGRGVPEIDLLEAQKNKLGDGAKVSQSVQMAPFNADYQAYWDTLQIRDPSITARNSYNGSAVQQAISCLTTLPTQIFNGTGGQYSTVGFEWWSDPNHREDGYITWQLDGEVTYTATAATMASDTAAEIGDRLISEEPMAIVLNLALSESFQNIDLSTLTFPAEFRVDYVRVYQRKGHTNVGCDGQSGARPTTQYIQDHLVAYSNANLTVWPETNFTKPKNGLYAGGC